jgi:hypothetical protein
VSTTLRQYLAAQGMKESEAMNILQEYGIVSDNAETVDDVGNGGHAVAFFEAQGTWTRGGWWRNAESPAGTSLMNYHAQK